MNDIVIFIIVVTVIDAIATIISKVFWILWNNATDKIHNSKRKKKKYLERTQNLIEKLRS